MEQKRNFLKEQGKYYGYGLGEFGFTFFLMFIAYHLLYFLTDVLQWPAAPAAVVYTVIQWFESSTNILMGIFVEKVNVKWGKYRPWMVIGAAGCAIFTVLFFVDWNTALWLEITLFCLFYLLSYTCYNLMWVSYRAMAGVAALTAKENVSYTASSAQLGGVSSLLYAHTLALLVRAFVTMQTGYIVCAVLCGIAMVGGNLVSAHVTRRYDNAATRAKDSKNKEQKLSFKTVFTCLNKPMVIFFIGNSLRGSNSVILQSLLIYYCTYVLQKPEALSMYVTLYSLTVMFGQTPAAFLQRKFGKTVMYPVSGIFSVLSILALNYIGSNIILFYILVVANSFCCIFSGSMIPAYLNEIADYTEFERGVEARSFIISIGGTSNKIASSIGGAFASFGLALIGYKAGAEVTPALATSIARLMTFSSAICVGLGTIAFLFYPLTDKKMEAIYAMKEAKLKEAEKEAGLVVEDSLDEAEESLEQVEEKYISSLVE